MNTKGLLSLLEENPIVAAVKNDMGLERSLQSNSQMIFVLYGDILSLPTIVQKIKQAEKYAFVHIDLIEGLSSKEIAVEFVSRNTCADGIISTKSNLIKYAKKCGMIAIQRFFLLDSLALGNIEKQLSAKEADVIEVLPGVMPKIISRLSGRSNTPLIAGGLIYDKEDVISALRAGAIAVSSTQESIWFL